MSRYTALLDANVLYPAPVRDIFLQLAVTNLFTAKWTEETHREWPAFLGLNVRSCNAGATWNLTTAPSRKTGFPDSREWKTPDVVGDVFDTEMA